MYKRWMVPFSDVEVFIETKHRISSKYDDEERGRYLNWLKHNRQLINGGEMREERVERFMELLEYMDQNRHKNQYV